MIRTVIIVLSFGLILPTLSMAAKKIHHDKKVEITIPKKSIININTASTEELASIKGLGVKKAKAIADSRKKDGAFSSFNDLKRVSGIGDKIVLQIQKQSPANVVVK